MLAIMNDYYPSFEEMARRLKGRGHRCGECLIWDGKSRVSSGHVPLKMGGRKGRSLLLHRMAYEVAHRRRIKPRLVINHKCGNPACFEPSHLEEVTHAENMQYRVNISKNNTTGYPNIHRIENKYQARLTVAGTVHASKRFSTVDEARAALAELRRRLNVPEFDASRYPRHRIEYSELRSDNTTGYRGVTIESKTGRFRARAFKMGKCYANGTYATAEEAAVAAEELRNSLGVA